METERAAITTATASDCRRQTGNKLQTADADAKFHNIEASQQRRIWQLGFSFSNSLSLGIAIGASASATGTAAAAAVAGGAKWQVNKSHLQATEWHQLPAAAEPPRIKSTTHSMMKLVRIAGII